jgi:hypothetical protein
MVILFKSIDNTQVLCMTGEAKKDAKRIERIKPRTIKVFSHWSKLYQWKKENNYKSLDDIWFNEVYATKN